MIVIDTHVLLWWANSPRLLSTAADEAVTNADIVAVSAITAWEVAVLRHGHRIEMMAIFYRGCTIWKKGAIFASFL